MMRKFGYVIVIPKNADATIKYAAKEFEYIVRLITGKSVEVVTEEGIVVVAFELLLDFLPPFCYLQR